MTGYTAPAIVIEDESIPLPLRPLLNFVGGGVTATDDPVDDATVVNIPGTIGIQSDYLWRAHQVPVILNAGDGWHKLPFTTNINSFSSAFHWSGSSDLVADMTFTAIVIVKVPVIAATAGDVISISIGINGIAFPQISPGFELAPIITPNTEEVVQTATGVVRMNTGESLAVYGKDNGGPGTWTFAPNGATQSAVIQVATIPPVFP